MAGIIVEHLSRENLVQLKDHIDPLNHPLLIFVNKGIEVGTNALTLECVSKSFPPFPPFLIVVSAHQDHSGHLWGNHGQSCYIHRESRWSLIDECLNETTVWAIIRQRKYGRDSCSPPPILMCAQSSNASQPPCLLHPLPRPKQIK